MKKAAFSRSIRGRFFALSWKTCFTAQRQGESVSVFHEGLIEVFSRIAMIPRNHTSPNSVCLSGGTLQNAYLATRMERLLREAGFDVFTLSQVPAGDGGLSLGQAVVAAHREL